MEEIVFLGDVYIDKEIEIDSKSLSQFVINLEYVYGKEFENVAKEKVNLKSEYDLKKVFKENLPIAVCLANNHIMDFGEEGLKTTLYNLNKDNIKYFGAGKESDNFNNPLIMDIQNKKIALLGYNALNKKKKWDGYGVAEYSSEQYREDVNICKMNNVDTIIVYIHFGIEEYPYYTKIQQEIAHELIDYGADLVIGQHPHCIQPMEEYRTKKIFYSIGNAIFPNFCVNAFYDDKGKSRVKYSKRNLSWNNEGLAIKYNFITNEVKSINRTILKKNKYLIDKEQYEFKNVKNINLIFLIRKILSVIASSFFIGGHIVNISFIRNEFRLLIKNRL